MVPIWLIGFLSTVAGVSVGGVIAALINKFRRSVGTIYAVCIGLLLSLLSVEIVPEAIERGNVVVFVLGFLVGVLLFKLLHLGFYHSSLISKENEQSYSLRMGVFLALILSMHNLPMGMVLATSEHFPFGLALLQTLILHNIPEGMILFTPLFVAGVRFYKVFLLSIFIAAPVALGAFIGGWMGMQSNTIGAFLLSVTVGSIYMVTMKEILPASIKYSTHMYSIVIACIAFGLLAVYLVIL
ncbi:ZIP family metal transporter [Sporosarcina obsidiansis]|uniref:ZIP family metal transporter n=1 Tax=Sporosarcina obsidiansis TaxID=2660748 RepID=UPI0018911E8D|nr:ZIP family metal transporter [Sporosarcina obsidiansis]